MRIKTLPLLLALVFALLAASASHAQPTASLTANATTYAAAGGQVVFTARINYAPPVETPSALGFILNLPSGWAYVSTGGTNLPQVRPAGGTTTKLEYAYTAFPDNQATFTVTVSYSAGLAGNQTFPSSSIYRSPSTTAPVTIASSDLTLTSTAPITPTTPTITTQPASVTTVAGFTATFTVITTGTPNPTYQWRRGGVALAGQTNGSLSLPNVAATDAGAYDVVVVNSAGTVTSATATLTVNHPPAIVTQPVNIVATQGQAATFSVVATGTPALAYQWRKNGNPLPGAMSATLTLPAVASADAGNYDVVVTNIVSSRTSTTATLTVNAVATGLPVITAHPASQTVSVGTAVTLNVAATGAATLSYQWRRDGAVVAGATAATLTLSGAGAVSAKQSLLFFSS